MGKARAAARWLETQRRVVGHRDLDEDKPVLASEMLRQRPLQLRVRRKVDEPVAQIVGGAGKPPARPERLPFRRPQNLEDPQGA